MALRIIRKSSSQSQVELIRGSSDEKPEISLLCFFDTEAQLKAVQQLIQNSEWIQQKVQCVLMKGQALESQVRTYFSPLQHTIKLLNEPKDASWSLRLRTLIQEASSEICLFLPFVPEADPLACLQAMADAMAADPNLAMVAPALSDGDKILAAGQDFPAALPAHRLDFGGQTKDYEFKAKQIFYLYQDLPLSLWTELAKVPLQVSGLPLVVSALRREAYLSLAWTDQDWNLPWLAQGLSLALRQQQYLLQVLPQTLPLNAKEALHLESLEPPAAFKEIWSARLRNLVFNLYRSHGLQQEGLVFSQSKVAPRSRIESYYAEKVAQSS